MKYYVLHEYCVVWEVFQQRLKLEVLLALVFEVFTGLLNQHFDVTIGHLAKLPQFFFGLL